MASQLYASTRCSVNNVGHCRMPAVVNRRQLRSRPVRLSVAAFKENSKDVKDWRVKQMVDVAHGYLIDMWSKGDLSNADRLLDDKFVYRDVVWHPERLVVGQSAMKTLVRSTREAYPDLWYEIEQVGFCDSNHIFVYWTCRGTNLAPQQGHRASHHYSYMSGIDYLGFNSDRSKISEANVYRQQTDEERELLQVKQHKSSEVQLFQDCYQIQLARLHWEPNELHVE